MKALGFTWLWAFFTALLTVLFIPALFFWVGWMAFSTARVDGVNFFWAMIFIVMFLGAWTLFLQAVDAVSDWVATRAKSNITAVTGEMAGNVRELSRLQNEQTKALGQAVRAAQIAAVQGQGPVVPGPMGGLDFDD